MDKNKLYSVIMTSSEFRLFSDWVEEYEKEKQELVDKLNQKPGNNSWEITVKNNARKDGTLRRLRNAKNYLGDEYNSDSKEYYKKSLKHLEENPQDEHYYRLSRGTRDKVDNLINTIETAPYKSNEHDNALERVKPSMLQSLELVEKEDNLKNSGYDDKYSSKRLENLLKDKIDEDDSHKIIFQRDQKNDVYAKDTNGKLIKTSIPGEVKRHYRDARIVYDNALEGRSLDKDLTVAAGITAGLVGGGIALKRHLKKKKQAKDLVKDRFHDGKDEKK